MVTEVIMPKLGLTMIEGKVIQWLKKEGEKVQEGETLFTVETDKVALDVESPASGTLLKILVHEGESVPIAEVIGFIGSPGEPLPEVKKVAPQEAVSTQPPLRPVPVQAQPASAGAPTPISPLARRLAEENHVDISQVVGTGPGGRIVEADIQKIIAAKGVAGEGAQPVMDVPSELLPINQVKRITARRMSESFQSVPHFYLNVELNCDRLVETRERLQVESESKHQVHLTYTDFLMKALALTLPKHPLLNAAWEDGQVRVYKEVHLGLAVSTPQGLVVAVIHQVEKLSLVEIASRSDELTQRARESKLTPDDVANGTFTLTNLGMYGVDSFLPIINPPQSAILAVGAMLERPVSEQGKLVMRPTMKLTLAADHRVVDGVEGAEFLKSLVQILTTDIKEISG
jgi:pyruvate dehydrogenase E2 component (dihydrolipoamide acetyltransferase)